MAFGGTALRYLIRFRDLFRMAIILARPSRRWAWTGTCGATDPVAKSYVERLIGSVRRVTAGPNRMLNEGICSAFSHTSTMRHGSRTHLFGEGHTGCDLPPAQLLAHNRPTLFVRTVD